jgi:hypothetical protein
LVVAPVMALVSVLINFKYIVMTGRVTFKITWK